MATVFSELILRYDGNRNIQIRRRHTNGDNTGVSESVLSTHPCIPPAADVNLFEMAAVPNNASRVTANPFSSYRGLQLGAADAIHRLTLDDSNTGMSVNDSATFAVSVRRKAFPAEAVTGNVVFNNALSVTGSIEPPAPEFGRWEGLYSGAFTEGSAIGNPGYYATSEIRLQSSGSLTSFVAGMGWFGNHDQLTNQGSWLPAGTSVSDWEGRYSVLTISHNVNEYNSFYPLSAPTPWYPMTSGLAVNATASANGSNSYQESVIGLFCTIEIRRINNPSVVVRGTVTIRAQLGL